MFELIAGKYPSKELILSKSPKVISPFWLIILQGITVPSGIFEVTNDKVTLLPSTTLVLFALIIKSGLVVTEVSNTVIVLDTCKEYGKVGSNNKTIVRSASFKI